jgi:hypothetical protein
MYSIYALKCPTLKEVVYVGMTKDVVKRYYQHTRKKTNNPKKDGWVLGLKQKGLKPLLEILDTGLNLYDAEENEKYFISKLNPLFNTLDGGLMPPSQKGKKQSVETKRKRFENSPLKKIVIQKTKDGEFIKEFEGVREAWRITGIDHRSIAAVASGSKIRKTAGGFIWKYLD